MIHFILGMMTGGVFGVVIMCLCQISGQASRREEEMFGEEYHDGRQ